MYIEFTFLAFFLAALAALFSSIFQSISGFAGALMLAVLVAPIFGVKESVPLTACAMLALHERVVPECVCVDARSRLFTQCLGCISADICSASFRT